MYNLIITLERVTYFTRYKHHLSQNIEEVRTTRNVIGYFEGSEEPDRYVILGNHRDAWVFGAMDPSSGTCVMLEGEHYNYL